MDYKTHGVCSQNMSFDIKDHKVYNVHFTGGCLGNLVEGMDVDEVISRVEGIKCGPKSTSCPDQLARALKEAVGR